MTVEVDKIIAKWNRLRKLQDHWLPFWQELSEVLIPKRATFTHDGYPGEKRTKRLYDGTPIRAARDLASSIESMIKPKNEFWFGVTAADDDLNEMDEVKEWLEHVRDRMLKAMYNRRSFFIQSTGEADQDITCFGGGHLFIGENSTIERLVFRHIHPKSIVVERGIDGEVTRVFLHFRWSARQAEEQWKEQMGPSARQAFSDNESDKLIDYLRVVQKREDRDPRIRSNTNMPFASLTIDVDAEAVIRESGFPEFPYISPTWDLDIDEVYGRGPGMLALPDAHTLNAQAKTLLVGGQRAVDPPMLAANKAVVGHRRSTPGGWTYFNPKIAKELGGQPIYPMDNRANIPIGREMQNDTRDMIMAAFFRNVFSLPIQGPHMTATEVIERKEEFIRVIGPVFGRLEASYTGPLVETVYAIMARNGGFREAPRVLQGRDIEFEYESPIEKTRKKIEALAAQETFERVGMMGQVDPGIWDNFDLDEMARDVAAAGGARQSWIVDEATRDDRRRQRQQQIEQEQTLQTMERGASAAADAKKAGLPVPTREELQETAANVA